jgi:hypothetical protein
MMPVSVEITAGLGHAASNNWKEKSIFPFASAIPQRLEGQIMAEGLSMVPLNWLPLRMEHIVKRRIHPNTFDLHVQVLTG